MIDCMAENTMTVYWFAATVISVSDKNKIILSNDHEGHVKFNPELFNVFIFVCLFVYLYKNKYESSLCHKFRF